MLAMSFASLGCLNVVTVVVNGRGESGRRSLGAQQ
jgi:hypothetical protein